MSLVPIVHNIVFYCLYIIYSLITEILKMMFACGDSIKPMLESAHLIERIVHQQLVSLLLQAQEVAEMRESKYIRMEDILFVMRKDKMKLRRAIRSLCFTDIRHSLVSDLMGTQEKRAPAGGKRRQLCREFLMNLDNTGQLLQWVENDAVFDEVREERKQRADQRSSTMDARQYLSFAQARGQSFTHSSNTNSVKLRAWLFAGNNNLLGDASRPQKRQGQSSFYHFKRGHSIGVKLKGFKNSFKIISGKSHPPCVSFGMIEGTAPLTPDEIREAVQRYWSPISTFNLFSRNTYNGMHRHLFCK
ncbi:hypothetical protein B566_EDAN008253 [Ephemera danica]|nr:hypothetical protein B566_EDAN008253 [Ephemera danica]